MKTLPVVQACAEVLRRLTFPEFANGIIAAILKGQASLKIGLVLECLRIGEDADRNSGDRVGNPLPTLIGAMLGRV